MMVLEFIVLITVATGAGAPYCKIIYPCFFISLLVPICLFFIDRKAHLKIGFFSIAIILTLYGSITAYAEKIHANNLEKEKREIVQEFGKGRNAIFIRNYAEAYDDFPFLSSFDNTLVITLPNGNWEKYSNDQLLSESKELIVQIDSSRLMEIDRELENWLKKIGFHKLKVIYEKEEKDLILLASRY